MKKISLLITIILLAIGLSACDVTIVEIPIETDEPVVPVVPVERDPITNGADTSPEIIVEFVDRFITAPATIERQRQYVPGTYMLAESRPNNQNGYVFSVVVIGQDGRIAGVYIDQTISTRNLFRSPAGDFYTLVRGNRVTIPDAYRMVSLDTPFNQYPTRNDAIAAADLVVGIDANAIRQLTRISVNETKQLTANNTVTSGLNYQQQMQAVAQKIINDNTTYGFNLIEQGGVLTTSSIPGMTEALDIPLFLVQSILDGPAALSEDTVLPTVAPRYGVYQTGTYASFSPLTYVDEQLIYGFSFSVVDAYGRMIGLYLDEIVTSTARSTVVASKQILKTAVGLTATQPLEWFEQANAVAQQILSNQGIKGIALAGPAPFEDTLRTGLPALRITNMTNIAIRANEILLATQENINQALFSEYVDGTYYVKSPAAFAYVTIQDKQLVDVYVDRFVQREQAQVFRRNQSNNVETFVRQFSTPIGLVSADIVVYSVGDSYYSVHQVTEINSVLLAPSQVLEMDQLVTLTNEEQATKRPVPGWHTASSLRQIEPAQETWIRDQQQLATLLVEAGSITDFQLVNGRIPSQSAIAQVQVTPLLDLVADALYQARQVTTSGFSVPFIPQSSPIANGSHFVFSGPQANGSIHFTYMVVQEGKVISWIVDSTVLQANQVSSRLFAAPTDSTLVELSNALRTSQHTLFASLIDKVAPSPTIQSIRTVNLRNAQNELIPSTPYDAVLNAVIRQVVVEKHRQDIAYIQNFFLNNEAYFKNKSLVSLQFEERWLLDSIVDPALSYEYRLVWRTNDRDLFITKDGDRYSLRMFQVPEDRTAILELEIFLPDSTSSISRQLFELPLRQLSTYGSSVLNSKAFDLPSTVLIEQAEYVLPSSESVSVSWFSSRPEVMNSSGQTFPVTQATTVELTAFVDLDANGQLGVNEPARTYSLTILPLPLAITRLTRELDTKQIGEFIGTKLTLENNSSIWGLSYQWTSSNQSVTVMTSGTTTRMYVAALDGQQTIQITANVNVPENNISNSYRVHPGSREVYLDNATLDLPSMNNQRPLIQGQSIFGSAFPVGPFYRSQLSFVATDFGQFVNEFGIVIYQHPTIDACFDAVVTSKYSGGVQEASTSFTDSFCVMSIKTLQDQMNQDRDQLKDYLIDLTFTSHVDTPLQLPLEGWIHQHPIRWEVVDDQTEVLQYFDVTNLASGLIVVKTTMTDIPVDLSLQLNAVIDITAGTPPVAASKEIVIEVQG